MAIKKTPVKSTIKTTAKVKDFKRAVKKEATYIGQEGKVLGTKVGTRWGKASTEEKVYTILGILLLIWGLYVLKTMI